MTGEITPFDFRGHEVRVVMVDGEPWWVINDVCAVLGIEAPHRAVARLPEDDLRQTQVIDPLGRAQQTNAVNESGLYELIFRSDKPAAREFRRWVTKDVLPQIRKTGSYVQAPDSYLKALEAAAEIERKRLELAARVNELAPKAAERDAYVDSKGLHTLAETAQSMCYSSGKQMGRQRLIDHLRKLEILCKEAPGEGPRPRQEYVEKGWFELHPEVIQKGRRRETYMQTYVTPVGVTNIWRALVADGEDLEHPHA